MRPGNRKEQERHELLYRIIYAGLILLTIVATYSLSHVQPAPQENPKYPIPR